MRLRGFSCGNMVSVAVHAAVLLTMLGVWRSSTLAPTRLPGTQNGTRQMLVYSLGGPPHVQAELRSARAPITAPVAPAKVMSRTSAKLSAPSPSSQGVGGTGDAALGDGNITIALVRNHPRPQPDLSALAHGAGGDVVLDVTIDELGKITQMKLARGLGDGIDQTVIATVQQWTFAPATKDGVPVPSEQEILFHYERS